ncbi:hypothetical protein ACN38_g10254 [Penicillium nordicum]|uniref:Uncharacterized protein n=1 Tax=Penicillium nordicum TaxID=229535 RepID=A0A0M8NWR7_9EURO|nr:hypothetical protein ACN38_g10254 [Penicillium nordicum]
MSYGCGVIGVIERETAKQLETSLSATPVAHHVGFNLDLGSIAGVPIIFTLFKLIELIRRAACYHWTSRKCNPHAVLCGKWTNHIVNDSPACPYGVKDVSIGNREFTGKKRPNGSPN